MSWNTRTKNGKAKKALTFLYVWVSITATTSRTTVSSFVPSSRVPYRRIHRLPAKTAEESHSSRDDYYSDVIIIGGGLTGMATAVALQNQYPKSSANNLTITIYEQATALRKIGAAIGLYPNGLAALKYIDSTIAHTIQQTASPCQVFERRNVQDGVVQITEVPEIQATAPVMYAWFLLQQALRDALLSLLWPKKNTKVNCAVELGHSFQRYDLLDNGLVRVVLERSEDCAKMTKTCRLLVGADGIHSRVRDQIIMVPTEKSSSSSTTSTKYTYYGKVMYRSVLDRALLEEILDLPEGTQISWQGTTKGQSFSLRETTEGIVTVTATAVVANNETTASNSQSAKPDNNNNNNNNNQEKKKHLQNLFQEFPWVVQRIMDNLSNNAIHEDFIRDVSIPTRWSDPDGPVVLIGDAAHAMTPHMGQGANMGLEDVCELVHRIVPILQQKNEAPTMDKTNDAWKEALDSYCQSRLARVQEVQDRSRQNTLQSNSYDKQTASIPFQRRQYSESFKDRLYNWKPPLFEEGVDDDS